MRIQHKYLRNKHYRSKHWKRVRSWSHPFETICPYSGYGYGDYTTKEQVKNHFEWITKQARAIENGETHFTRLDSAPKWYRKQINRQRKAQERSAMAKIRNGDYDSEFPKFKPDAAWDYW
jgi:hypothetical protein